MSSGDPIIRPRSEHTVSRRDIDPDALRVLYRLASCGHTAYLVGGSVRDLLLGRQPKDFDVGTDAHPQVIRRLFRNCFLIGKRFRLAHVKFGDKVIETSTFRRQLELDPNEKPDHSVLRHHRDDSFGTPEEDALRRDFTVNGLFYDIRSFDVIDYVGGLEDLDRKLIRSIGDANVRFCEDPVRMLRAVRFAARLGFTIEDATYAAIVAHRREILKASPPRLLEEIYRLFGFQSGAPAFRLLWETGLMEVLFPDLAAFVERSGGQESVLWRYLEGMDQGRCSLLPQPTQALMFSTLYYPLVRERVAGESIEEPPQYGLAAEQCLQPLAERLQMPKQVKFNALHIVDSQRRLEGETRPGARMRLAAAEAFPEIVGLCEIHLHATGGDLAALQPWVSLRAAQSGREPVHMAGARQEQERRQRRRRRPRGRRRRGEAPGAAAPTAEEPSVTGMAASAPAG